MKEQWDEIEQLSKQSERRKFYKSVDSVRKGFKRKITNCKASTGKVICEGHEVLERREEYFKDLLNKEVENERTEDEETEVGIVQEGKQRMAEEVNIDQPTRQELAYHIQITKIISICKR